MGLDSIELVLAWEECFGISIPDAEAESMRTTLHAIEFIYKKVKSEFPEDHGCLSMRAFLRLRKAFEEQGVSRSAVRKGAKVAKLLPDRRRRDILNETLKRAGFGPLKRLPFDLQRTFMFMRVRDLVIDAVIRHHETLRLPGHGWSRSQVREVVRAVMDAHLALRKFSDDAEIVKDLGVE
jgi:hypothetical protein